MNDPPFLAATFVTLHILIQLALVVRVLLRPHRDPASRIAWVVVIVALPVLGIFAYILFGEVNIGRSRVQRMREVLGRMPAVTLTAGADANNLQPDIPERHVHLFYDPSLTADMRQRQGSYIAKSRPVTPETVEGWTWRRRLWNNTIAMLGPVL